VTDHEQLLALSMPFPQRVIHEKPGGGGGSYVPHHLYTQRLLLHLHSFDLTMVEKIEGYVPAKPATANSPAKPALEKAVVGVVLRLTVVIDGEKSRVEEVGDCEQPHNWGTDGARLKDAWSDAVKRCCARLGLGTHLYAKEASEYILYEALKRQLASASPGGGEGEAAPVAQQVGTPESEEPAGVTGPSPQASPPSEPDTSPSPDAAPDETTLALVHSALAEAGPHAAAVLKWAKAQGWAPARPPTVGDANALLDFVAALEEAS
jgi:hypothetical protein